MNELGGVTKNNFSTVPIYTTLSLNYLRHFQLS